MYLTFVNLNDLPHTYRINTVIYGASLYSYSVFGVTNIAFKRACFVSRV